MAEAQSVVMPVETPASLRRGWPRGGPPAPVDTTGALEHAQRRQAESDAMLRWLQARDGGEFTVATRRARSALARRFDRLNAPVVYPWSPSMQGAGTAHQLHRVAAELLRTRSSGFFGTLWLGAKAAAWPALATAAVFPLLWRCGRDVRRRHGTPIMQQMRDLFDAVWTHGIFPTEYYHHRVFATAAVADKARYLSERELLALISAADRGSDSIRLDDIRTLFGECCVRGTPVARTFAFVENGRIEFCGPGSGAMFPQKDLFLRPRLWSDGDSGVRLRWHAGARAWSFHGEMLSAGALVRRLQESYSARPHLVQECLHNHPEMARFSEGGLCTVRIATGVGAGGEPVVLFAALTIPGANPAEPESPGIELVAGVEPCSGTLMRARGEFVADGEFESHPANGAIIAGAVLPHWESLRDFALRSHLHYPRVPFVGWELALTAAGPVLLEASTNWGHFDHVLPAETAFAEICLHHLARQEREALAQRPVSSPESCDAGMRDAA